MESVMLAEVSDGQNKIVFYEEEEGCLTAVLTRNLGAKHPSVHYFGIVETPEELDEELKGYDMPRDFRNQARAKFRNL